MLYCTTNVPICFYLLLEVEAILSIKIRIRGDKSTSKWPKTSEKLVGLKRVGRKNSSLKNREI